MSNGIIEQGIEFLQHLVKSCEQIAEDVRLIRLGVAALAHSSSEERVTQNASLEIAAATKQQRGSSIGISKETFNKLAPPILQILLKPAYRYVGLSTSALFLDLQALLGEKEVSSSKIKRVFKKLGPIITKINSSHWCIQRHRLDEAERMLVQLLQGK